MIGFAGSDSETSVAGTSLDEVAGLAGLIGVCAVALSDGVASGCVVCGGVVNADRIPKNRANSTTTPIAPPANSGTIPMDCFRRIFEGFATRTDGEASIAGPDCGSGGMISDGASGATGGTASGAVGTDGACSV